MKKNNIKCSFCKKAFKDDGSSIVSTSVRGGTTRDYLHEECHYPFISEWTDNNWMDYEEFIDSLLEEE